jgi:hypothetical protein
LCVPTSANKDLQPRCQLVYILHLIHELEKRGTFLDLSYTLVEHVMSVCLGRVS